MNRIQSADGTAIAYSVQGEGPGLLIIHGAFRASQHYQRLADELSGKLTVYLMDRRGRNQSGPLNDDYSLKKASQDAIAILQQHRIPYLFGHSFGAVTALHVAKEYPLAKLAVYEPASLSRMDLRWFPRFERLIQQDELVAASVAFIKGMQMGGIMQWLPNRILEALFRRMAVGEDWETNCRLLRTVPADFRAAMQEQPGFEQFRDVSVPTLVLGGTSTTVYLKAALADVARSLPNCRTVMLRGLNHNGPDEGNPQVVAEALTRFLLQ